VKGKAIYIYNFPFHSLSVKDKKVVGLRSARHTILSFHDNAKFQEGKIQNKKVGVKIEYRK